MDLNDMDDILEGSNKAEKTVVPGGIESPKQGNEKPMKPLNIDLDELNYWELEKELANCYLKLSEEPSLEDINRQISRVQGLKDRVAFIFISAIKNTNKFKRIYEAYHDNEVVSRTEKNEQQREAATNNMIRDHYDRFNRAKLFESLTKQVFENIVSCNENLSRQVTVIQEQIKLGEIRRPDTKPPWTDSKSTGGTGMSVGTGWDSIPKSKK